MSVNLEGKSLFILDLEYQAPVAEADPFLEAHLVFVNEGYEKGLFLASGPKVPRTGGVIIAASDDRESLEAFLSTDPFCEQKLATYTVTEFQARRTINCK